MLFHLQLKNIGVKNFESMAIWKNSRCSHGPSLNCFQGRKVIVSYKLTERAELLVIILFVEYSACVI